MFTISSEIGSDYIGSVAMFCHYIYGYPVFNYVFILSKWSKFFTCVPIEVKVLSTLPGLHAHLDVT